MELGVSGLLSDLVLEFEGGPNTACFGDVSTISKHSTTSTTSTTATPTPTGFGLMVFSDTDCTEYINGYTRNSNGKCYDMGTEINSYIITTDLNLIGVMMKRTPSTRCGMLPPTAMQLRILPASFFYFLMNFQ